jgi:DNA-binding CsgD family transcriptional regulator
MSAFLSTDVSGEEGPRWLWLSQADLIAGLLWDHVSWDLLSARRVKLTRDAGALTALPFAATIRAGVHLWAGEFAAAAALVAEVESVTEATGSSIVPTGAIALAAFTGREADAAELIEAATRSGAPERAAGPLQRLSATARASGTDWALGVEARSRALMREGQDAETLYREAIDRLGRTRVRMELAHQMLAAMGADAFAERAARELRATGERARPRSPMAAEVLTPQEEQIGRLVAGNPTNREIAGRLFISASGVEYHLRKIFRKLGVSSRTQLARTIQHDKGTPAPRD